MSHPGGRIVVALALVALAFGGGWFVANAREPAPKDPTAGPDLLPTRLEVPRVAAVPALAVPAPDVVLPPPPRPKKRKRNPTGAADQSLVPVIPSTTVPAPVAPTPAPVPVPAPAPAPAPPPPPPPPPVFDSSG